MKRVVSSEAVWRGIHEWALDQERAMIEEL